MSAPQFSFVDRFNWDHTFSPTLLNHFAYGYGNRNEGYGSVNKDFVNEFPLISGVAGHDTPPAVSFGNGYYSMGNTSGPGGHVNTTSRPEHVINDLLTWVRSKHTFKFGGEWRNIGGNSRNFSTRSGDFYFGDAATGLPGFTSGNSFASFLLGAVDSGGFVNYSVELSTPVSAHTSCTLGHLESHTQAKLEPGIGGTTSHQCGKSMIGRHSLILMGPQMRRPAAGRGVLSPGQATLTGMPATALAIPRFPGKRGLLRESV